MTIYKQIPGVQTYFRDFEIRVLIDRFKCQNMDDLVRAAKRYESLFFMFDPVTPEGDMMPGEDMRLMLAYADQFVFENLTDTDECLRLRHPVKVRGRKSRSPLPDDLSDRIKEAQKEGLTQEAAVQRLKALGVLPESVRTLKAKTILKYIREHEDNARTPDPYEAFKDFAEVDEQ